VSLSDALKRLGLAAQRDESGGLPGHTLHAAYVGSKLKFALIRASRILQLNQASFAVIWKSDSYVLSSVGTLSATFAGDRFSLRRCAAASSELCLSFNTCSRPPGYVPHPSQKRDGRATLRDGWATLRHARWMGQPRIAKNAQDALMWLLTWCLSFSSSSRRSIPVGERLLRGCRGRCRRPIRARLGRHRCCPG
jgi:hypothetical protein